MKLFISWSGETSFKIAQIFREWIPYIINSVQPYVSAEDIDKGARWSMDIAHELEDSSFGIVCVTKDNLFAPWLSFEAGALSKTVDKSYVTPFLYNIKRSEVSGPILQFQSTIYEKNDILRMMKTINRACLDHGISESRLEISFEVWYPKLEEKLNALRVPDDTVEKKESPEETIPASSTGIIDEILDLARENCRILRNPDKNFISEFSEIKSKIELLNKELNNMSLSQPIGSKHIPAIRERISSLGQHKTIYGFFCVTSLLSELFPWIQNLGNTLIAQIESNISPKEKAESINSFNETVGFYCDQIYNSSNYSLEAQSFSRDLPYLMQQWTSFFAGVFHCTDVE